MASKFSRNQWNSYHSGRGYRLGYEKRSIVFKHPENRKSFQDGYKSLTGKLDRYPKIKRKRSKKS